MFENTNTSHLCSECSFWSTNSSIHVQNILVWSTCLEYLCLKTQILLIYVQNMKRMKINTSHLCSKHEMNENICSELTCLEYLCLKCAFFSFMFRTYVLSIYVLMSKSFTKINVHFITLYFCIALTNRYV